MSSLTLPSLDKDQGLTRYFSEIWSYPILKPEEEYALAVRWREDGNIDAAHKLVTSHLRLVAKIASGYRGYGLPVADLIAEGNIGLMKAVKKFEPERGFRLATYAMWWIRAAITEYVLRSWSMVKLGTLSAQKKLFFSLNKAKRQLNILEDGNLSSEQAHQLAVSLDVSSDDVIDMDRRLASPDVSLNAPRNREEDEGNEFIETLVDYSPSPETFAASQQELSYRRTLLLRALGDLPERERHILNERQLSDDPKTLEQLGEEYGISRERVRQLEARALDRIGKSVRAMAARSEEVREPIPA